MNTTVLATLNNMTDLMIPQTLSNRRTAKLVARASAELLGQASVATTHEKCRALLTYSALENLTMLSSLEEQCHRLAPLGALRYRHIVDAYAVSAAQAVARW